MLNTNYNIRENSMKINMSELQQIIQEECQKDLPEGEFYKKQTIFMEDDDKSIKEITKEDLKNEILKEL